MSKLDELMALAAEYAISLAEWTEAPSNQKHNKIGTARTALQEALKAVVEDAERLQFFEYEANKGMTPNLVFDDDGNWSVSYDGMQPCPRGDGEGFDETVSIVCIVEPQDWRPSVREAIDAAIDAARKPA